MIFEKTSIRTRCAFEVAAHSHSTRRASCSRFYDAIEFRGAGQELVDALIKFSDVPIYNGLTDEIHPTQFLADALTMMEHVDKPARQIAFCYIGDCRFNTADSLLIGGAQLGMDVRLCGPRAL